MAILIADDNAVARAALMLMLRRAGFEVEEADGGNACIEKFESGSYDLVISDIDMPDMDGVQVARHLRRMSPDIELYAFSGSSGTMLLDEASEVFTKVFSKPMELTRLVAQASAYCSSLRRKTCGIA